MLKDVFNKQEHKDPSIMQRTEDMTGSSVCVLYIRKA
jgi:hypothetical protein